MRGREGEKLSERGRKREIVYITCSVRNSVCVHVHAPLSPLLVHCPLMHGSSVDIGTVHVTGG